MTTARTRTAMTLFELLIVIVILGLFAGLAMMRAGAVTYAARLEQSLGRLENSDETTRNYAARHAQSGWLRFELGTNRFERAIDGRAQSTQRHTLGSNIVINRFVSTSRDADAGDARIDFTSQGASETYAIEITSHGHPSIWLLFAGLTGQVVRLQEADDVASVFQAIREAGPHTR